MAFEGQQVLAGGDLEDLDRPVGRAGGELDAAGVEGEGQDRPLLAGEGANGLGLDVAARELPEPGDAVGAGREDLLVVGQVGEAEHGVGRSLDHALRGTRGRVPEADRLPLVPRGDLVAVPSPGDRLDVTGVAGEFEGRLGGLQVPDFDDLPRRDGEPLAVGIEGDRSNPGGVLAQDLRGAGRGQLPDFGRLVEPAGEDSPAVLVDRDGEDQAVVAVEPAEFLPGGDVPEPDGLVEAAGDDGPAVGREGDGVDRLGVAVEGADGRGGLLGDRQGRRGEGRGERDEGAAPRRGRDRHWRRLRWFDRGRSPAPGHGPLSPPNIVGAPPRCNRLGPDRRSPSFLRLRRGRRKGPGQEGRAALGSAAAGLPLRRAIWSRIRAASS